jgi:hypothetical protein
MGREVTLVLVRDGDLVGALAPFAVEAPWWPEVGPVADAVRARHGAVVQVLRLLRARPDRDDPFGMGGSVVYVAELEPGERPPTRLDAPPPGASDGLAEHPRRMPWARPGGPAAALAWARRALADAGLAMVGPARQVKTWNLSALWRLHTDAGPAWLKLVAPFLGHEGDVIATLRAAGCRGVPRLLAHDGARAVLADIPGDDGYAASARRRADMARLFVGLSTAWPHAPAFPALPSWGANAIAPLVERALDACDDELDDSDRDAVAGLAAGLADRLAAAADCGVPEALIHGDAHAGNVRDDGRRLTVLDWGDSGLGNPLLDLHDFLARTPAEAVAPVRTAWLAAWAAARPGSDPARAAELLAPVAPLRLAAAYRRFLEGIEPSEHVYHAADVPAQLRLAARAATAG